MSSALTFRRRLVHGAVIGLVVLSAPMAAIAQERSEAGSPTICTEPVAPTCMESDITYSSQQRIDRCERTIARYQDQLDDYLSCLDKKIRQKRQKGDNIMETFERRAGGDEDN